MYIKSAYINCFRNIHELSIELIPGFNIFYGQNGAGKTSLLEAIYYLGRGKSFRTHLLSRIVEHDAQGLMLTATVSDDDGHTQFIGLERRLDGSRMIKRDRNIESSIAPIARMMPLQLLSVDSDRYFRDGPKYRRDFLNWGVFHRNTQFLVLWQQFHRILKQRNSALKNKLPKAEIMLWNTEYTGLSQQIDLLRQEYLVEFNEKYQEILAVLLPEYPNIELRYQRGWPNHDLITILESHFLRDFAVGHTQAGPHRCDLQLYLNHCPVDDVLSQGQQKLAAYGLHLAQGILIKEQTGIAPVYLIDDLPSELDLNKQALILNHLVEMNSQVLITSIQLKQVSHLLEKADAQVFHVEHGVFSLENEAFCFT